MKAGLYNCATNKQTVSLIQEKDLCPVPVLCHCCDVRSGLSDRQPQAAGPAP